MTSQETPHRVDKYEIIEEIGRGGFAVVYKARDTELDRIVALKVLAPHLTWDPTFAERFRREAQATARLRHPHVVTVHDVGQDGEQLYIAMEYLPGPTLRELLDAEGALPLERALPILEQTADALDYAHEQGAIHRDVKPSNLMIEEDRRGAVRVTLTDFGLVKAMEASEALTSVGTVLGSPEYMAPEQADPARRDEIGPATDRYALGVVAYHMLTGRVPFPGSTPATLHSHLYEPPPHPQSIHESLPAGVARVLIQALSKAPAERYPSAMAMVEALRQAQAEGAAEEAARQAAEEAERQRAEAERRAIAEAPVPRRQPVVTRLSVPSMAGKWGLWGRWTLTVCAALAAGNAVGWLLYNNFGESRYWAVGAAVGGAVAGLLQWRLLRRILKEARWWVLATIAEWIAGWVVASTPLETEEIVLGAMSGVLQWLMLRRTLRQAGAWVLFTVVSWSLLLLVLRASTDVTVDGIGWTTMEAMGLEVEWTIVGILGSATVGVIGGAISGAITGLALALLPRRDSSE
jgi:hypothetical protein